MGGGSEGDVDGGCDGLCRLRRVDWRSDADTDALRCSALGAGLGSEGSSSPRMSSSSSGPLR